jgi:hypothetical protein
LKLTALVQRSKADGLSSVQPALGVNVHPTLTSNRRRRLTRDFPLFS